MRQRTVAILAHGARGLGLAAVFTTATLGGVVLHANLAGFRRAGAEIANRVMAPVFEGRIVAGEIESLSIGSKSRAKLKSADILDPNGKRVIHAEGIDATINLRSLLESIADGKGPAVELEDVRIANADLVLDRAPDGTILIARTFQPRPSEKPAAPPKPTSEPTAHAEPYLDIASIRIARAHVRGNLVPPALEGDAENVKTRLHLEHDVFRLDLDEGRATLDAPHAPNQNAPISGAVKGALTVAIAAEPKLSGHAELDGTVGAVPLVAHAQIDGDDVDATVDVARVEAAPLVKAFEGLPFGRPVEAHVRAHGKLPALALDARGRVGESDIVATGEIDLREGHAFKLDADAKHVDASAYGAPVATDISTKLHAEGVVGGMTLGVLGSYRIATEEGTIAKERVPATTIEGKIEEQKITATLVTKEPGADLSGTGELDLGSLVTTFDVQARSSSLRQLSRAPNVIGGSASARARGKIDLRARTINAATSLHGDDVAFDLFTAKQLDANGQLHGPLAAPVLDASFTAKELLVQAKDKKPLVYPAASGQVQVAFVPTVRLVSASVDIGEKGGKNAIGASASNVSFSNGVVEARGVSLTGLGEPLELDARVGAGGWTIRAKSKGVDLHRVAVMTGIKELEVLPAGTRAELDVDVRDSDAGATGHVDVVVTSEKGALLGGGVKLETHATIERGHVSGSARIGSEGLGFVEVKSAELDIPGRLDARSLERTTGVLELRGSIDLAQGGVLLGGEHIEQIEGVASFEGRIERGDPSALPAVRATVKTKGLAVVYSEDPSKPSTKIAGVDMSAHVAWDGRTEDAEVSFMSWDRHGLLGNAAAKAKVPLLAWAKAGKVDPHEIGRLEVAAIADVPTRQVATLPAFLGLPALIGKVAGRVTTEGPIDAPRVVVSARVDNLRADRDATRTGGARAASFEPLDGVLEARWDASQAAITFALDERTPKRRRTPPKRVPGHVHGLVMLNDLRMRDILYGDARGSRNAWSASSEIEVENLNLGALPIPASALGNRGLDGELSGRFRLRDVNRAASLQGQAQVTGFGVAGATVEKLDVTVFGRDASVFAHAKLTDKESSAILQLTTQSVRVDGLDVTWNTGAPSRLDYAVQNASLALLAPLVRRQISEIDGRVNGTGSITIDGDAQVFEGGLGLTGTNMYVNALGEEIVGLTATARFDRSGRFNIEDATGKMGNGEFHAKVTGKMKGFSFQEAQGSITATKEGIPISSEGANFASASGEVDVKATMSADRSTLDVELTVPRANITLPDRSTQQLQPLEPDPKISIGLRRSGKLDTNAIRRGRGGSGRNTPSAANAPSLVTKIDAKLGDKVHLEGRGLDVILGGHTIVQVANEVAVTGQIDLRGGSIQVHGRQFTVDRGVVSFAEGGDAGNPSVVAAAYWDAPDRTRVWVEFAGPLKSGTLTLRSEPAYSKNEILSILLFGRPDPNQGTGSAADKKNDAGGATAIGTGFVASDINRMLSEIDENLDIETDTMSGNRARTKLGYSFFDRRFKAQIGVAPGQTTREKDTTFLFLTWQFMPKWSVVTTNGDKGTSILDVLFQHRY